jgi:lipoprotein-anchoring transpeptidase ErfK/SrfK
VKRSTRRLVGVLAVLVLIAFFVWVFLPRDGERGDAKDANLADANAAGPDANTAGRPGTTQPAGADANTADANAPDAEARKAWQLDRAAALAALRRGRQLVQAKRLGEGRTEMSKALLSGNLPPADADAARKALTALAEEMIFSRQVHDADPYAFPYTFGKGEVLARVERKLALHVPTQLVLRINRVADARAIREGQTLKMIRGPFHAIVTKGAFTLDLYLHRKGVDPVYVKRLRVGLGRDGTTPVGLWRVALGKKLRRAPWNPPPNSTYKRRILWGQPDYPLGREGYWISLEGIDRNTEMHVGYGLHGTNDPSSIGKAQSLGCIRLSGADIELVFSLLYEKWSTVRVLP